ncbi:hypothetical protein ACHQM5_023907 [Ranunculus cassubicifolius]
MAVSNGFQFQRSMVIFCCVLGVFSLLKKFAGTLWLCRWLATNLAGLVSGRVFCGAYNQDSWLHHYGESLKTSHSSLSFPWLQSSRNLELPQRLEPRRCSGESVAVDFFIYFSGRTKYSTEQSVHSRYFFLSDMRVQSRKNSGRDALPSILSGCTYV